jgi:hypothetical protein
MNIQIEVKSVFGTLKNYPANDAARTLARLVGTKTLSTDALKLAKQLGHTVTELLVSRLES